jgi:hypothetical protein
MSDPDTYGPPVDWLRLNHPNIPQERLEPFDVPGYWRDTELCGGVHNGCRQPVHSFTFNEPGVRHAVCYTDPSVDPVSGRFTSPYRTWRAARAAFEAAAGRQSVHRGRPADG